MTNLKRIYNFRRTIKILVAYIKTLRHEKTEVETMYINRQKELLHAITVANRRISKLNKQVENYRNDVSLLHFQKVVKSQGLKMLELNQKINEYEMEKM